MLVTKPKALLLDEPLGDLDRLLQLRMRVELRNLQRQLGLMFIHVTHNQEEALSMADRIVVMNDARIQQVADPLTIATRPETELVARFMGDNNIIRGHVTSATATGWSSRATKTSARACVAPGDTSASATRRSSRSGRRRRGRPERRASPGANRPRARSCSSSSSATSSSSISRSAASGCSPRCPVSATPAFRGTGRRADPDHLEGGGCPAPPGLSLAPLDAAGSSDAEELEQARREERALGDAARRARARRRLGHRRWALPGGLWLGFFLLAPLVFIVLVSFWTYKLGAKSGFTTDWTLANYGDDLPQLDVLAQHARRASTRR